MLIQEDNQSWKSQVAEDEDDIVYLDIQSDNDDDEEEEAPDLTTIYRRYTRPILGVALLVFDIVGETAPFYTGLSTMQGKLIGCIEPTPPVQLTLTAGFIAQCINLNLPWTHDGLDIFHKLLVTGKKIKDWAELTPKQTKIACAATAIICPIAFVADGLATAFYLNESLPENWPSKTWLSYLCGAGSACINIPTEYILTHMAIRNAIHFVSNPTNPQPKKKTPLSRQQRAVDFSCSALTVILTSIGAAEDMIDTYTPMTAFFTEIMGEVSTNLKWGFLGISVMNGITDAAFNGKICSDALDDLKKALSKEESIPYENYIAFLLAFAASAFVADALRSSVILLLTDPEATLPEQIPDLPDAFVQAFSWGSAAQESVTYTYYFFPLFLSMVEGTQNLCKKLLALCQKPEKPFASKLLEADTKKVTVLPDDYPMDNLKPSSESTRLTSPSARFFKNARYSSINDAETPAPKKSWCTIQ